jgi:methionine synthase / methylenetetrahydrofolate reductase(NADPH)
MDFLDELNTRILCGDGAMGTELMSAGVPMDVCFEELNVSAPDVVSRIHDSYVAAGARLIETNTFGANASRLSKYGLENRVRELNQAGIRLARKSIGTRPIYLAASIGPLGIADPHAELQEIDRADIFTQQVEAILDESVDVLFLETFTDFTEIQIALNAARALDKEIPVICSMVCSEEGRLPSSLPIVQAFRELVRLGANVVGDGEARAVVGAVAEDEHATQTALAAMLREQLV